MVRYRCTIFLFLVSQNVADEELHMSVLGVH
jgi:hypothetical protein